MEIYYWVFFSRVGRNTPRVRVENCWVVRPYVRYHCQEHLRAWVLVGGREAFELIIGKGRGGVWVFKEGWVGVVIRLAGFFGPLVPLSALFRSPFALLVGCSLSLQTQL